MSFLQHPKLNHDRDPNPAGFVPDWRKDASHKVPLQMSGGSSLPIPQVRLREKTSHIVALAHFYWCQSITPDRKICTDPSFFPRSLSSHPSAGISAPELRPVLSLSC